MTTPPLFSALLHPARVAMAPVWFVTHSAIRCPWSGWRVLVAGRAGVMSA